MKKKRIQGKGAIDLMEEAVHLVRLSPARVIAAYYIGTLPFILGFLYFWADMSKSPFAYRYVAPASFGLALLFIWMKCWQSVFCAYLKARVAGRPDPSYPAGRIARLIAIQTIHQPSALFALPLSLLIGVTGWLYAYYHNLLLTGDGESAGSGKVRSEAWRLAKLWQGQNHSMMSILFLLGFFMTLNVGVTLYMIPSLLKMFFDVDTAFTQSAGAILNTTFWAVTFAATFLCMDPLVKAFYVLRCFYGEAIHTAADLKADLKGFQWRKKIALLLLGVILISDGATAAPAARKIAAPQKPPSRVVVPDRLDRSIQEEIEKREYQWRLPRQKQDEEARKGILIEFLSGIMEWTRDRLLDIWRLYRKIVKWLQDKFPTFNRRFGTDGAGGFEDIRILLWILSGIIAGLLLYLLWKFWKQRRQEQTQVQAEAVVPVPDLTDENVTASQLPEEGWQALARDLLARGELRLALRALYMATLAHLGASGAITIARYKSNYEYQREMQRRARDKEQMLNAFSENLFLFERSWYGTYDVTPEILNQFGSNHDRIVTTS